ncbi:MAG: HAMP domain-containing histidine kinase [Bacteroidetes bacterium]|nr:HAMP domain-containing histidine kinase [Bacteroidota bacterium]
MNLKNKISFIVSLLFTVIFAVSASVIYILFADFRKEEFEILLNDRAVTSIKLLVEVEQVDRQLLKIIDQNRINKIYDEKTLIFDSKFNLIYSSLDDTKIDWTIDDLKYLKKKKTFFRKDDEKEVYGVFYDTNQKDFYALISATDNFGKRKLEYLLFILIGTYIVFTILCWFITAYVVKRLLLPIDAFHNKLRGINENNLGTRVDVKEEKDEIDLLADEFNQMLQRIDISYQKQKEFTSHASHELRTPIARVTAQLENKIIADKSNIPLVGFYKHLLDDINQISELISSLLLLSKLDNTENVDKDLYRIDELIFEAAEKISKHHPDFKLQLNIEDNMVNESLLEVKGNKALLDIALNNLLKNAYIYSDDKQASGSIYSHQDSLYLSISNTGVPLTEEEQQNLFQPFMRGGNAKNKSGLGLGLRMVQRILSQQGAVIAYKTDGHNLNSFLIKF